MSENNNNEELVREIRELTTAVGRLATNHKSILDRHERDILAAFQTAKNHHASLENLHAIVARQNEILSAVQVATLRLLDALGMEEPALSSKPPSLN